MIVDLTTIDEKLDSKKQDLLQCERKQQTLDQVSKQKKKGDKKLWKQIPIDQDQVKWKKNIIRFKRWVSCVFTSIYPRTMCSTIPL